MLKLPNLNPVKILHDGVRLAFVGLGFRWEVRRSGDVQLGLWRIQLRKPAGKKKGEIKRVVFAPGFGDTALSWLWVITLLLPVFRKQYDELIMLDFPGYRGFLCDEKCAADMGQLQSLIGDLFDSLKPHTLMGHSMGGWLSAFYASQCGNGERPLQKNRHYEGPKLLLVVDPSGVYGDLTEKKELEQKFSNAAFVDPESLRPHLFHKEPLWFKLAVRKMEGFLQREDVIQFMKSIGDEHFVESRLSMIRCPVRIVWGEEDTLIPSKLARVWQERLSSSASGQAESVDVVYIKKTGHSPQMERPIVTAAILAQLLLGKRMVSLRERWWKVLEYSKAA